MILKKLEQKLDLSKRFPGYFNKKLLRSAMLVYFLLLVIAIGLNGWDFRVAYFECSIDSPSPCTNAFYGAEGKVCNKYPELCNTEIVMQGEILGKKPHPFVMCVNFIGLSLVALSFLVNDLIYRVKKKW